MENVIIVGAIIGLTQAIKQAGVSKRYIPITAVFLGVGLGLLVSGLTVDGGLMGLVSALSAMGLWSGTRTSLEK